MAYIGLQPQQKTVATSTQQFSGNSVDHEFTLNRAVSKASDLIVFVGGAIQIPEVDYTAQNKTLLFVTEPPSGTNNINVNFVAGALTTINLTSNSFPVGTTVNPSIRAADAPATGIYWPSTTTLGLTVSGNTRVTVSDNPTTTSPTTGALVVDGGVGVGQALHVAGATHIENTTQAINTTTGALIVQGGVGIAKDVYVGGSIDVAGAFTVAGAFNTTSSDSLIIDTPFVFLANNNLGDSLDSGFTSTYNDGTQRYTGLFRDITDGDYKLFDSLTVQPTTVVDTGNVSFNYANLVVGNITATNIYGTVAGGATITVVGNLVNVSVAGTVKSYDINYIYSTIGSTSTTTGALQVSGGVGVVGNVYAGAVVSATNLTGTLTTAAQTNITSVGTLTSLAVTGAVTTSNIASDNHNYANGTSIITTLSTAISTANTAMKGYVDDGNTIQSTLITTVSNSVTGANAAIVTANTAMKGYVDSGLTARVTSVTGTAPVTSSGGTTPAISMAAATASVNGYMTSTYASKLDGIAAGATNVTNTNQLTNGAGFITSSGTATNLYGAGASYIASSSSGTGYGTAIQIREAGLAGAQGSAIAAAPRLAFHWSGVVASSIVMEASGRIAIVNNPGTSYEAFACGVMTGTATNAQYADLAENYQADAVYEPGTVLHFGGEFEVTQCDIDMCARVAGVVSTAPAHLMNTALVGDNVVALALTGRVPCLVQGTVRKGDMMVSAGNGHARAESNPRVGSVIGKALENFDGPEGVIEVVVGRV